LPYLVSRGMPRLLRTVLCTSHPVHLFLIGFRVTTHAESNTAEINFSDIPLCSAIHEYLVLSSLYSTSRNHPSTEVGASERPSSAPQNASSLVAHIPLTLSESTNAAVHVYMHDYSLPIASAHAALHAVSSQPYVGKLRVWKEKYHHG